MKYIISLGGSLIAPNDIDIAFLRKFRATLLDAAKKGDQFVIIPGGGQTCRRYQKAAKALGKPTDADLDWIGIAANKLHTALLKAVFGPTKGIIVEVGGLRPGGTSDTTAVAFAKKYGIKNIVNLTDVDGFYDRDPKKFRNAKHIDSLTWTELRRRFGSSRKPGRELPFDSAAASASQRLKIRVVILSGYNLKNFQSFLAGKTFKGTTIE